MSIKMLRNMGLKPNLEKDDNYENNNSYILKGQRVYNPKRKWGALNPLYFENEVKECEKALSMTFLEILEKNINRYVIDEEDDEYDLRDDQLLDIYCSIGQTYKEHKKYYEEKMERALEILLLIEFTKNFKYIKGASNSKLIVFDLERKNIGEWE